MKSNSNFLYAEIILTKYKTLSYCFRGRQAPGPLFDPSAKKRNIGTSTNFKGWVVTTQILISLNE